MRPWRQASSTPSCQVGTQVWVWGAKLDPGARSPIQPWARPPGLTLALSTPHYELEMEDRLYPQIQA